MDISESGTPFRHWVIDGAIPSHFLLRAQREIPPADSPDWVRYANELERKRTVRSSGSLGPSLCSWTWLALLQRLTGIPDLKPDMTNYGGGFHVSEPGDFLACHLDYSISPEGLERRLNLLVYLNDCEGGETEFWDAAARFPVKKIPPRAGRILLWECSDLAYHGTSPVLGNQPRNTLAVYYYSDPTPGCSQRRRALFVPNRSIGQRGS